MKPLEGIRILDFTQFMSGPICTLMLADYGAEVIKLENPPLGDTTRYGNIMENKTSSHYATRNRGKKSVVVNMKDPAQKELFLKLVETADAVVENFKPGTMEKFGITYEVLEKINPRIVYTSISGYGQEGPYAKRAAYDATVQAESGVMSITGEPGGRPLKCGGSIADYSGGLVGCIGTLMGIIDAQRTGHGRRVDVSMMDALLLLQENLLSVYLRNGKIPQPNGNRYPASSPIGDFLCKDGIPVMLNISTDAQWKAFSEAFDQPQWLENPHFASMSLRADHYQEVEAEVNRVFSNMDSAEVVKRLTEKNSIFGLINNYEAIKNHPQVAYRKTFVNAVYPNGTTYQVPGSPMRMSGMENEADYATAMLGEDTIEVFSRVADPEYVHAVMDPVLEAVKVKTEEAYSKK